MRFNGKLKSSLWAWMRTVAASFLDHHCSMHAAGLTYFSLLAVVPVLCCVLVVAKTFGVDRLAKDQINGRIDAMISSVERAPDDELSRRMPLLYVGGAESCRVTAEAFGSKAREISNAVFVRIERFDIGTLGWVGFVMLLWTVISSLASVETSFNEIFGVTRPRTIWKRAVLYLFVMIILPVLGSVAMSLPVLNTVKGIIVSTVGATAVTRWMSDGLVAVLDSWLFAVSFTFVTASAFFSLFFWMMPNCRVRFRDALVGGVITSVLFGGWVKVCTVAQVGIARSSALYGSFALLPIVLAWLYMSWQIVLLGAVVTAAVAGGNCHPGCSSCETD